MSIDQRTILEILLGLYKLEAKYKDSQQQLKKSQKTNRNYRQYIDLADYDDEDSSIETIAFSINNKGDSQQLFGRQNSETVDQNDVDSSPTLTRLESQNSDTDILTDESDNDYDSKQKETFQNILYDKNINQSQENQIQQDYRISQSTLKDSNFELEQLNISQDKVKKQRNQQSSKKSTTASSIYSKINDNVMSNKCSQQLEISLREPRESSFLITELQSNQIQQKIKQFLQGINKQHIYEQYIQNKELEGASFDIYRGQYEVQFTNLGLIKKKMIETYIQQGIKNVNNPQISDRWFIEQQDSVNQLLSDYIVSAYSYEFSAIRLQQSNILIRIYFLIQQFLENYDISKEDDDILDHMIHSIQQIEKRNQEIRAKTVFCCQRIMATHSEKFLICNNCGKLCNFHKKSVRKDRNEGSQRNTSYHSIRHFDDVFKQLFIQPIEPIDSITRLQLQEFMIRDHKQKVTIEDVRQYLKQLPGGKGSKLNKSDAFIMGVLNGETLKISNIEYQFIKNTFQQFIQILYKNAETRKNTPNCVSFIKKIIDLLYKDVDPQRHQQIVKRLHQQKENTTRKMQKTWQFLIDQFDVKQLKQEFKETIKSQTFKSQESSSDVLRGQFDTKQFNSNHKPF